jgi:hypothetical protein
MFDVLVTTGAGNVLMGGSDIWVNNFLENVYLHLDYPIVLLIDGRKPIGFNPDSIPCQFAFSKEQPLLVEPLLRNARKIHFLHNNYYRRDALWEYKEKFHTLFCHAYIKEIINTNVDLGLDRVYLPTTMDLQWEQDVMNQCKQIVWIGCNDGMVQKDFKEKTIQIPNYYEFDNNIEYRWNTDKIGYAARSETRKCFHFLDKHRGYAITDWMGYENLKEGLNLDLKKIRFYPYNLENHKNFFNLDFTIFHGCYVNEPFGYSIFNAVDYGKLPILNKYWMPRLNYKYRASTKEEFNKMYDVMCNDFEVERQYQFNLLKKELLKFNNKTNWIHRIKLVLNKK